MKFVLCILFFLIGSFLTESSLAKNSSQVWILNNDHSELLFKVSYLGVSDVTGRLGSFKGKVLFDDDLRLANSIEIEAFSNSISTGNNVRDGHLKSQDFLNVKKFPSLKFKSRSIEPLRPGFFKAQGVLTIKGRAKDYTVFFKLSDMVQDTWGHKSLFMTFEGELNRNDFGVSWNKSLKNNKYLVGNIVNFWGKFQLQAQNFKTPTHKHMIPDTKYIRMREKLKRGEALQEQESVEKTFLKSEQKKTDIENHKKNMIQTHDSVKKDENKRQKAKSLIWWVAYFIVGLVGFGGSILICFQGKRFFARYWSEQYEEMGYLGILSDLLLYPLVFAYAWGMWVLGS